MNRSLKNITIALTAFVLGITTTAALGQDVKVAVEKAAIAAEKSAAMAEKAAAMAEKAAAKADKERGFCNSNNWSSDNRVSFSELRESIISAGGTIAVDAGQNGGIGVKGEDRSDVALRACVQAWGMTEEAARALAGSIRIGTAGTIKADGPESKEMGWSVSYQLLVPRSSNLNLKAHNGGISIGNVDGSAEFETMNGGVSVTNVGGSVKGRTMNGGVNVSLSGTSYKGSGLDVETKNGGVNITLPENFAAHVETSTVNGGFSSDIPALDTANRDANGRRLPGAKISQDINGGGALVRAVTTNGGVRINAASQTRMY